MCSLVLLSLLSVCRLGKLCCFLGRWLRLLISISGGMLGVWVCVWV